MISSTYLKGFITSIIFLISLFPFVGKIYPGDLQPLYFAALLLFFFVYLVTKRRLPDNLFLYLLLISVLIIIFRLRFNYDLTTNFRGLVVYFTPFLMIYFIHFSNLSVKKIEFFIKISMVIYLIFAFLELAGFKDLASFMIDFRDSDSRGVSSLTPEPSMFGFTYILMFLSLNMLNKPSIIFWIIFLLGILLCGSLSVILASLFLVLTLVQRPLLVLFYAISILVLINTLPLESLVPARLLQLVKISSLNIFLLDESINERFGHLFYIFSNIHHYFFGGSEQWGVAYYKFLAGSDIFFYGSSENNILSGIGAAIYDGGILGIIFLLIILRKFLTFKLFNLKNQNIFLLLSWGAVAIQSVSFAHPLLTLPIALQLKFKNEK